jgi:hypothetical protein
MLRPMTYDEWIDSEPDENEVIYSAYQESGAVDEYDVNWEDYESDALENMYQEYIEAFNENFLDIHLDSDDDF